MNLTFFGCIALLGLLVIGGWAAYPFLTGNQYMGTVSDVKDIGALGFNIHVITLQSIVSIGQSNTYVVAPQNIAKGDFVIVHGDEQSIPIVGKVVYGGGSNFKLAATVSEYSTFPLLLGIGLLIIGVVGLFVIGIVFGAILAGSGLLALRNALRWVWKVRKSPVEFVSRILFIFGAILQPIALFSSYPTQSILLVIGILFIFSYPLSLVWINRKTNRFLAKKWARWVLGFSIWLGSLPVIFLLVLPWLWSILKADSTDPYVLVKMVVYLFVFFALLLSGPLFAIAIASPNETPEVITILFKKVRPKNTAQSKQTIMKYIAMLDLFPHFDYQPFFTEKEKRISILTEAMEYIFKKKGKERYLEASGDLLNALAFSIPSKKEIQIHNIGFLLAVRASILKTAVCKPQTEPERMDLVIKKIISKSIIWDEGIDIFEIAGLSSDSGLVLSEKLLSFVEMMPQKNLAYEALRKLLKNDERIRERKKDIDSWLEDLEVNQYSNLSVAVSEIVQDLIDEARLIQREIRNEDKDKLNAAAFLTALQENETAKRYFATSELMEIAKKLVQTVNKTRELFEKTGKEKGIDSTYIADSRNKAKNDVINMLKKYDYPLYGQEKAKGMILDQVNLMYEDWDRT